MNVSEMEISFIKQHEGFRANWYDDGYGNYTIGYGYMNNSRQLPTGFTAPLTEDSATALLQYIIPNYESIVNAAFPSKTFTQGQFDALVDFVFNLGSVGNDLKTAINNGISGAALLNVFCEYVNAGGVYVPYLRDIRTTEYYIYSDNDYTFPHGGVSPNPWGGGVWGGEANKSTNNNFPVLAAILLKMRGL